MDPIPVTISTIRPPPSGTPQRSVAPGLAIRERAVIVPKRPVVMSSACGTRAGETARANLSIGAIATPDRPVNAAKRPERSAAEWVCFDVYMMPISGTMAARPGISGCMPTRGVAIVKSDAPAAMPTPIASVPYTLRMCSTAPAESASNCEPVCSSRSRTYEGKAELGAAACCCCEPTSACRPKPKSEDCCCAGSGSFSSTSTRRFFVFPKRDGLDE
mmetsp:Transcript_29157/g.49848  ORF Transcript_29157/g.49848 Transcript_29157/m.49848 type:complete len:217 (-) Transcript_29157:137-787(-)